MLPFAKFHPATLVDLHTWSTLSRNEIRPFLTRFGIEPLGSKYPMLRVYEAVLGLSPEGEVEEKMLGQGLIRVSEAASMIGLTPDALLARLRTKKTAFPPLHVFGPKRNLMLRAQVEEMLRSPRNAWHGLDPIPGHALPASRLARRLKVAQSRIDALLEDKDNLPAQIITRGHVHFIVADVAVRLGSSTPAEAAAAQDAPPTPKTENQNPSATSTGAVTGGLFSAATKHAAHHSSTPETCTESGPDARRGDGAHRVPAEAKLSGT